jgi:hypothetical protein
MEEILRVLGVEISMQFGAGSQANRYWSNLFDGVLEHWG